MYLVYGSIGLGLACFVSFHTCRSYMCTLLCIGQSCVWCSAVNMWFNLMRVTCIVEHLSIEGAGPRPGTVGS